MLSSDTLEFMLVKTNNPPSVGLESFFMKFKSAKLLNKLKYLNADRLGQANVMLDKVVHQ